MSKVKFGSEKPAFAHRVPGARVHSVSVAEVAAAPFSITVTIYKALDSRIYEAC